MKHIASFIICASIATGLSAMGQTAAEVNKFPGYTLSFHDEFTSGTPDKTGRVMQPDSSVWEYELGYIRGNQRQYYTNRRQNIFLKDGLLYIRALPDTTLNPEYNRTSEDARFSSRHVPTSASIYIKDKFRFHCGIIETRAKIPAREGYAPAIWMSGDWHYGYSEIDIMEWITGNDHTTVHWGRDWRNIVNRTFRLETYSLPENFWDDFHTWRTEWNHHYIRVYLDDAMVYELPMDMTHVPELGISPFCNSENKMNLKLNLAFYTDIPVTTFPGDFIIDYTRIYTPDKADSPLVNRIAEANNLLQKSKGNKGYTSKSRRALQKAIKKANKEVGKSDTARIFSALNALDIAIADFRKAGPKTAADNRKFEHWGL